MLKPPLQPMLLSDRTEPFNSPEYLFEIKWDGYRSLLFIEGKKICLQSRNQKDLTPFFPEISQLYRQITTDRAVLDGEICTLDNKGNPVFSHLQGRLSRKNRQKIKHPVTLVIWDILETADREIYHLPLLERKEILEKTVIPNNLIQLSPFIREKGVQLYEVAEREKLEGIVAKKIDSPYEFKRSSFWYKIKVWQYIETIICGFDKDRTSLVVGRYQDGESCSKQLVNMGKVKLALTRAEEEALFRFLPEIITDSPPFPEKSGQIIWVRPTIKCQVRYTELTNRYTFRHGFAVKLIF